MRTSRKKPETKTAEIPPPPSHLTKKAQEFWTWAHECRKLNLKDTLVLKMACETYDEAERARLAIKKHGMVFQDRFKQQKPRPEVQIEQAARAQFVKITRTLNLYPRQAWESDDD
jgi:phage terminase small subunit